MAFLDAIVEEASCVGPGILRLRLKRPEEFSWKTGQFALLGVLSGGRPVIRAYSIASPGNSETVDFFITLVREGQLTPLLFRLGKGDRVLLDSGTSGFLLADNFRKGGRDLWLLATGTGVSPFLAVTADPEVTGRFEKIILVHGVRTWAESAYVKKFICNSPKLRLVCAVTREGGAVIGKRIPEAIRDGSLEKLVGCRFSPWKSRVMLCGSPAMIESVSPILRESGITGAEDGTGIRLLVENFGF